MTRPSQILLQTTIQAVSDDWNIGRFSMLRDYLSDLTDENGEALFQVTARDRAAPGAPDPVLSTLDASDFDALWLFAVDTGDGLDTADCDGISRFRRRGGGLMVTRDHMDLGCSVCVLGGVGAAHVFHTHNVNRKSAVPPPDDKDTPEILWPNFHSGANGDYQHIVVAGALHPILRDTDAADGIVRFLPAHPHEGAVVVPEGDLSARVIATGVSQTSGLIFNIAVAFEPSSEGGPAIAESTFHHFADYNWDKGRGCPSFVSELPGISLKSSPPAMASVHRYVRNVALWLVGRL
ncbi:hypothetical protein HN018_24695 (plasmid) [Lichenicola cladoniae]|uniref:Uncharacterized protein n=1 Tax=Lichenicola cladoniae TaxID=1484109 RepID=A0A6M8HXY8_9PROT|nr:hypothetical protein [Lichenicola cladoniae]NPD70038.1 hypothetical protein [Acetobacteraceae bacterium]QKE93393.1 hypothetical protein HN018_24695 [Lichenicola cladoniae]